MNMQQRSSQLWTVALLIGSTTLANAFSIIGPLTTPATAWQVPGIGLSRPGDIGNPENTGEEYRWNVPDITYAFDDGFLNYFGQQGVQAVEEAIGIINNLGPLSNLSPGLDEFPVEALRPNPTAAAMGIRDLKTTALSYLLELLGLAQSDRYIYVIRNRTVLQNPAATNYFIIHRNFDPVTFQPSEMINDTLFNFTIEDPIPPANDWADAFEEAAAQPPFNFLTAPVTALRSSGLGVFGGITTGGTIVSANGIFATGLSRDDAGGLRYIYRAKNYNVENLLPDVTLSTNGTVGNIVSPWIPYFGITNLFTNVFGTTNITGTSNTLIATFLRPGIETIAMVRTDFDSLLGQTTVPITNIFTDVVISNNTAVMQRVQRITTQPDIVFTAEDLGFNNFGSPVLVARGVTFINNDALNGASVLAGPGVLSGPARISFTNVLPGYFEFQTGASGPDRTFFSDRSNSWGSFGESPESIILYPNGSSLQELEDLVLPP
jgi:hypothetical protein